MRNATMLALDDAKRSRNFQNMGYSSQKSRRNLMSKVKRTMSGRNLMKSFSNRNVRRSESLKVVRFDTNPTTYEYTRVSNDPYETWYTNAEIDEQHKYEEHEAQQYAKRYGAMLRHAYHVHPPTDTQEILNAYARYDVFCFRGMERQLSERLAIQQEKVRRFHIESVVGGRKLAGKNQGDDLEKVAAKASEISLVSKKMAMRLGKADECAAKLGDDSSLAEELLQETKDDRKP